MTRRRIVGVMGSGDEEFVELAEAAGRAVARGGYHLLTGGGGGTMTATAPAFVAVPHRLGLSLGVVRADGTDHLGPGRTSRRYRARGPNPFVEVPILTHLPLSGSRGKDDLSRNHINVLTAAAVIVLPGGAGTSSELELAIEYGRPVLPRPAPRGGARRGHARTPVRACGSRRPGRGRPGGEAPRRRRAG